MDRKQYELLELPSGLVAYHQLDEPKAWKEGDVPKYSITVAWPRELYEKDPAFKAVKQAIHKVAVDAFGERANLKREGSKPYHVPFRYGEDHEKNPEQFKGFVLGSFRSKFPVSVVELQEDAEPAGFDPKRVAKGMRVVVAVKPNPWKAMERGVSLYPKAIAIEETRPDLAFNEQTERKDEEGDPNAGKAYFAKRRVKPRVETAKAKAEEDESAEPEKDDDIPF